MSITGSVINPPQGHKECNKTHRVTEGVIKPYDVSIAGSVIITISHGDHMITGSVIKPILHVDLRVTGSV